MATLNDFKIVKKKSKMYYKYLKLNKEVAEIEQARLGFYLFALECITNNKDIDELKEKINDTEFNSIVFGLENIDLGIDAVDIDEEYHTINLFNFKFRENFNPRRGLSQNDALISMNFVNAFQNSDSSEISGKTKAFVDEIIKRLNSDDIWNLRLYMVSNENNGLSTDSEAIRNLQSQYGLEVITYTLGDFSNFISMRPEPIGATLLLNRNSVLSYEEEDLSTYKSYLMKLSIGELIRITSSSKDMRNKYSYENMDEIEHLKLDFSVLFDNVRGYLGKTKFNKNIFKTLNSEPSKFFMYNNGITMTSKDIEVQPVNGNQKWKISLEDFQVVNGGQSLRTLYDFKESHYDEEILNKANVLVRVFKTGTQEGLTNKIAEFTNSQNAISPVDLKSLDSLQMKIEQILKDHKILYVRKVGDLGENDIEYDHRISMEKFGQLLYSKLGYPDRASNQKKRIFDTYYDEIFGEDNFDIDDAVRVIEKYLEISNSYEKSSYNVYEQKIFYALYLNEFNSNINNNIELIEKVLIEYKQDSALSEARKLIQKGFKDELDKHFKGI
ncbi:AIPR family protein [Virgibacillus kekensis]|uniref:AIPR family protein n=1 Tax=Virgibacillus kekensis TaxID=202261 RepID=A0ABV9DL87_9BACI